MKHRIDVSEVRQGMYVCGFGGSWFDHPFWRVKRLLDTPQLVAQVREAAVPFVEIDDALGLAPAAKAKPATLATQPTRKVASKPPKRAARPSGPGYGESLRAARQRSQRQEARAVVSRSLAVARTVFADARLGRAIEVAAVHAVVGDVVGTLERTPDTLLDVLRLKRKDEYTYLHSVAVCALMANAALHLGRDDRVVREYGMAGLLHDLGKMGTPDAILNKGGGLTESEFDVIRGHPEFGYTLLSQLPEVPPAALDVCRHHHEKMDGTGYPFGLDAGAISEVARLGAICDVYDALTSVRSYKDAMPPLAALGQMWWSHGHFDRELLFRFMQSLGLFPPGMLVHLCSRRLAVVREPRGKAPGTTVLAFHDLRDGRAIDPVEIVMHQGLAQDGVTGFETGQNCAALQAIRPRLQGSELRAFDGDAAGGPGAPGPVVQAPSEMVAVPR